MKIKSALATELSGSLGGLVASHNRGGLYLRARAVPVNPNTPQQQLIRSFVAQLTSLWLSTLTPLQRSGWDSYATHVPLPDRLGEPRVAGGLGMYVRSNVPLLQIGLVRVDDAPFIFNLGEFTPVSMGPPAEDTQQFDLLFDATDEWANETGAALGIWVSRPQNVSINFFKGPYRFQTSVRGDNVAPPSSPLSTGVPFPVTEGQRLFVRVSVTRADARLSISQRITADVIASAGPAASKGDKSSTPETSTTSPKRRSSK